MLNATDSHKEVCSHCIAVEVTSVIIVTSLKPQIYEFLFFLLYFIAYPYF